MGLTIVYDERYTDFVVMRRRAFLFTGFLTRREITNDITKVEYVGQTSNISIMSVIARAGLGASVLGPLGAALVVPTARRKYTKAFLVTLKDGDKFVVESDDILVMDFLYNCVE